MAESEILFDRYRLDPNNVVEGVDDTFALPYEKCQRLVKKIIWHKGTLNGLYHWYDTDKNYTGYALRAVFPQECHGCEKMIDHFTYNIQGILDKHEGSLIGNPRTRLRSDDPNLLVDQSKCIGSIKIDR